MAAKWFYRIASVLLVLFAMGHTVGFRKTLPEWGVDAIVSAMQASHFNVQGFDRTYYDFYVGFGLFVSVFLIFAAFVAWQLGSMSKETLPVMMGIRWSLAVCFLVIVVLSWRYFFLVPVVFSGLISVFLILGAWFSGKEY